MSLLVCKLGGCAPQKTFLFFTVHAYRKEHHVIAKVAAGRVLILAVEIRDGSEVKYIAVGIVAKLRIPEHQLHLRVLEECKLQIWRLNHTIASSGQAASVVGSICKEKGRANVWCWNKHTSAHILIICVSKVSTGTEIRRVRVCILVIVIAVELSHSVCVAEVSTSTGIRRVGGRHLRNCHRCSAYT